VGEISAQQKRRPRYSGLLIIITSREAVRELSAELGGVSAIGVDTEADSLHAYREKTCLIQISTRDRDYLVDPLAVRDLSPLQLVFADRAVCKVFHAADNDIAALRRDFGFQTAHLFDTMAAARILGLPRVGLADLLRERFAVELDKRLQRYQWSRRPIDPSALEYAAMDSHYLLPLADQLRADLLAAGRLEEAEDEFARLERSTAAERQFDPDSFWRIKGSYSLPPAGRAVLRELNIWRDRQAVARDQPPFRIVSDSVLLAVAAAQPQALDSLRKVAGVPPAIVERYARALLSAVERGLAGTPPPLPRRRRPDDAVLERFEALRRWRRAVAAARGVEADVIVSNAALQAIAERQPRSVDELAALGVLGPWKLRAYAGELLDTLRSATLPGGEQSA
jgi:ribonuclease D